MRPSGRNQDELRTVTIETGVTNPAQAGPDAALLRWAARVEDDDELLSPFRFELPASPHQAAAEAAAAEIADAQALIGICNEEILRKGEELHWIQIYWEGIDGCVGNPSLHSGDKVMTNGQRIASPALADHAIALMMALARGLDLYHANQMQGNWQPDVGLAGEDFMELAGRTALVVGLGGIGTQTAKRAHGLGMRVIATRNSRREGPPYVAYVGLADEALELARRADVVINTAPLTDATRGMFDAEFFAAMKPTAFFVSVGRGASAVTDDLVAALENGEIAGAGLDVTDPEPLPPEHPLWTAPRVIISPHTGGRSGRVPGRASSRSWPACPRAPCRSPGRCRRFWSARRSGPSPAARRTRPCRRTRGRDRPRAGRRRP